MINGTLNILNVGEGDVTISFDKNDPAERERAAKVVTDMLRRGFAILVRMGKKNGEEVYRRAKSFDPETCEYIVAGAPDDVGDTADEPQAVKPKRGRRAQASRVPAESVRSVSVGRTAGGGAFTTPLGRKGGQK